VLSNPKKLSGGAFQLSLSGPPGQAFSVRSTNNLNSPLSLWPVLTNGAIGASGSVIFNDQSASTNSRQFYRVTSP
jgi:hypothetical protein